MILKHTLKTFLLGGAFLVASIAFSAVRESFNKENFASLEKWSGDGSLIEESPAPGETVLAAGVPIGTADNETPKVLALEGQDLCSDVTGKQTDFLLNVSSPSDELPANLDEVQIAVAAGTELDEGQNTVPLMLYCKYGKDDGEETLGWVRISSVKVGTWIRVTLDFDYVAGRCKVSVDGVPVVSEKGSLKADGSGGNGAWYKLAKPSQNIASLTFVGSAKIDDVVVNDNIVTEKLFAESAKAKISIVAGVEEEVSLNDLNKWGITPDMAATAKVDDSGLTVAEKLECGLRPDDGKKFQLTDMEMSKITVGGVEKTLAKIKFPGSKAALNRYKVTARDSAGKNVSIASTTADYDEKKGEVYMDVIIPDDAGRVVFINVTADASTQQTSTN